MSVDFGWLLVSVAASDPGSVLHLAERAAMDASVPPAGSAAALAEWRRDPGAFAARVNEDGGLWNAFVAAFVPSAGNDLVRRLMRTDAGDHISFDMNATNTDLHIGAAAPPTAWLAVGLGFARFSRLPGAFGAFALSADEVCEQSEIVQHEFEERADAESRIRLYLRTTFNDSRIEDALAALPRAFARAAASGRGLVSIVGYMP